MNIKRRWRDGERQRRYSILRDNEERETERDSEKHWNKDLKKNAY